jgi:hypothetical protein
MAEMSNPSPTQAVNDRVPDKLSNKRDHQGDGNHQSMPKNDDEHDGSCDDDNDAP